MKDKDKLILLFNIYTGNIARENVGDYLGRAIRAFSGYFDDTVKCIFTATEDESKPTVQAVTHFPIEGIELIEKLVEYTESNDEAKLAEQIETVKKFIKEFKENGSKE